MRTPSRKKREGTKGNKGWKLWKINKRHEITDPRTSENSKQDKFLKTINRHIKIILQKIKDKEKTLKKPEGKQHLTMVEQE